MLGKQRQETAMKEHQPQVVKRRISELRPYAGNSRKHSRKQIKQIAASMEQFGFTTRS